MLLPKADGVEGFIERDIDDQYLLPWSSEQERLFAPTISQTPKQKKTNSLQLDPTDGNQLDLDNDADPDIDLTDFRS